jgi:alpha-tubulin suppressor-like RCC1 family protein
MLTQEGRVLACGYNGRGQLGLGDMEDRLEPCAVPLGRDGQELRAADIEAGWWHTLVLVQKEN